MIIVLWYIIWDIFILVIVNSQMTINILIIDYLLHLFLNILYVFNFDNILLNVIWCDNSVWL